MDNSLTVLGFCDRIRFFIGYECFRICLRNTQHIYRGLHFVGFRCDKVLKIKHFWALY